MFFVLPFFFLFFSLQKNKQTLNVLQSRVVLIVCRDYSRVRETRIADLGPFKSLNFVTFLYNLNRLLISVSQFRTPAASL